VVLGVQSSDFVANKAALPDALAHKEPESDLSSDQGVEPSFL